MLSKIFISQAEEKSPAMQGRLTLTEGSERTLLIIEDQTQPSQPEIVIHLDKLRQSSGERFMPARALVVLIIAAVVLIMLAFALDIPFGHLIAH